MKLRVWQDAIDLYVLVNSILKTIHYEHSKSKSNTLDAAHSIIRNIAEGYCRRSPKEYLNFLNYALGSCGELISGMITFEKAELISKDDFESFDILHYKTENQLLKLAETIQNKIKDQSWNQDYGKTE